MSCPRLDAGPLVAAVQARCRARRLGLYDLFVDPALVRAYMRAKHEGALTLRALEGLCDAQQWHPRELYGDRYDVAAFQDGPAHRVGV